LSNFGSTSPSYNYEYITFKDLFLDSNFKGGGISITNSLRINIDNCYITHFTTNGILVQSGHETYIRNTFIGQHITAGGDKNERKFSGIGISLQGNDNAITDVVIFSANIGILITGQANIISGVHCYNKASGFGGTGIYLKLPGNLFLIILLFILKLRITYIFATANITCFENYPLIYHFLILLKCASSAVRVSSYNFKSENLNYI